MIDRLFGKYKNTLLILFSILTVVIGLRKIHFFYQARIGEKNKELETMDQTIQSAHEVKSKQAKLSRLSENFIPPDSYKFINLISGFAGEAGLRINSLRYVPSRGGSAKGEEEVVSRIILSLNAEGSFKNMLNFLVMLEDSGLTVTITGLRMQPKRGQTDNIEGDMRVVGLAFRGK